ncbi:MAG: lytic transglycosylase domain-containing protein, partial [Fimbriimonas ginsengisoli]|nr:lytic transglycosylase domain-containing protein [Fimbriimonas ginsengisoli]
VGQTLSQYVKLRRHYGIWQAAGVEALETMVGQKVVEIQGVVVGGFSNRSGATLLVRRSDGGDLTIDAPQRPEWLSGGEIPARLLVEASRGDEYGELRCTLIGVAPEHDIARIERRSPPKAKPGAKQGSKPSREWILPRAQVEPLYAAYVRRQNPRLSAEQASLIARGVIGFSIKYGVDARLIMAMLVVESGFDPGATSRTGAQGLGQLMPGTAQWMGVSDAYDTVDNLYGTVKLVRTHLDRYGRGGRNNFEQLALTLAAYNAGEGAVARHGGVPPYRETQAYVRKVISLYAALAPGKVRG